MQNKKYNKYFEEQNTKPSRVSGNVRKRGSVKKGDYATGLFNDGNSSKVSSYKEDYPFKSPQRPENYGGHEYFGEGDPSYSGPMIGAMRGVPSKVDMAVYNRQQEIKQEDERYQRMNDWINRKGYTGYKSNPYDKDITPLNPQFNFYAEDFPQPYQQPITPTSPFDQYNPIKEFRRKNPEPDSDVFQSSPSYIIDGGPEFSDNLRGQADSYLEYQRKKRDDYYIKRLWDFYFGPKFKEYSD